MINPNLLTDSLAKEVAMEIILSSCEKKARERLASTIGKELLDVLATYANEAKRDVFFEKLLSSLSSHERKFASMMQEIWEEQRRIIVANLKKMKKAWLQKGKIDELLYPRKQFEQKIAKETKRLFEPIMEERAKEELAKIERELRKPQKGKQDVGVIGAFDVENPEVQKWLDDYTAKLSKKLETVSTDKLRSELIEGMKEGEGVPQLIKRVNTTYENWNKVRSETIARSEAMRASNRGAIESYRQSGVVKSKIWITYHDERTCYSCADLDGKVISLEDNFFNLGDPAEVIERGGRTYTFKNDYEDIGSPPRHARCRCTIAASFEDIVREKPWRSARTMAEAEKWGDKYGIKVLHNAGKKVDLKHVNAVNKEMSKVAENIILKTKKNKGRLHMVANDGITVHPNYIRFKGQTPRGWSSGTWDNVPGAGGTFQNPTTVIVANKTAVGHGSVNLTLHEYAHTVDSVYSKGLKKLSDSSTWKKVWKTNGNKGLIRTHYQSTYAEEYWAESFAEYFNTPGHGYLPKNVITYFNNLVKGAG